MKDLLEAKMAASKVFYNAILATEDAKIVEATSDIFWGCGLLPYLASCTKPEYYPGKNMLGGLLNNLRDEEKRYVEEHGHPSDKYAMASYLPFPGEDQDGSMYDPLLMLKSSLGKSSAEDVFEPQKPGELDCTEKPDIQNIKQASEEKESKPSDTVTPEKNTEIEEPTVSDSVPVNEATQKENPVVEKLTDRQDGSAHMSAYTPVRPSRDSEKIDGSRSRRRDNAPIRSEIQLDMRSFMSSPVKRLAKSPPDIQPSGKSSKSGENDSIRSESTSNPQSADSSDLKGEKHPP